MLVVKNNRNRLHKNRLLFLMDGNFNVLNTNMAAVKTICWTFSFEHCAKRTKYSHLYIVETPSGTLKVRLKVN